MSGQLAPLSRVGKPCAAVSTHLAQRYVDFVSGEALKRFGLPHRGGVLPFAERFDLTGAPVDPGYLRLRVVARQVAVFAQAQRAGLPEAGAIAQRGWQAMRRFYWSGQGGWWARVDAAGRPIDAEFTLYDQAFAIFACAHLAQAGGYQEPLELAQRGLAIIDRRLKVKGVAGWLSSAEAGGRDQNAHMHFLEALMALYEVDPSPGLADRITAILDLARDHLFDVASGTIAELFNPDWSRDLARLRIEPGHQFEWFWLLACARTMGFDHQVDAEQLYRFGLRAVGAAGQGLVPDSCLPDGRILDRAYRLWPQCEALRAMCLGHDEAEEMTRHLERMFATMLVGPFPGGWIERLDSRLEPALDHVPTTSLYHLWEAAIAMVGTGRAQLARSA